MDLLPYIAERLEREFPNPFGGLNRAIWDEIQSDENFVLQGMFLYYQSKRKDGTPKEFRDFWLVLPESGKRSFVDSSVEFFANLLG